MAKAILKAIDKEPEVYENYLALYNACKNETDLDLAHEINKKLLKLVIKAFKGAKRDIEDFYTLYKQCLLFEALVDFDSFMLYIEIDRAPREKFYAPRRKKIKHLVEALQELADDELDELFISQPPRTGKTTIVMFYVIWLICRDSERSNLYCAFSDTITDAFFKGVQEVFDDNVTYRLADVFPNAKIVDHNRQLHTLNVGRSKRYASLTARSLYGTLNGAVDVDGILIADDLIGGIEEALNPDRMVKAWQVCTNNMLSRAKSKCRLLWIGTRWSIIDPIGMRISMLEDKTFSSRRYKIINLPALDENDESLFDYDYDVGFSTQAFKEKRASFELKDDMPSWNAQYMGCPVERNGCLFVASDMRYYNGVLPEGEPDLKFMAVDPAFGGGDFVSAPICYQYGEEVFVVDWVYDNGDKTVTQPKLASAIQKWGVKRVVIEASKMTESFSKELNDLLKKKGIRVNIINKPANSNKAKEQRIFDSAPDIRAQFIFLETGVRSKEYNLAMQNVYSFTMTGKNKHDDAPDSLAMACNEAFRFNRKVEAVKRIW